MRFTSIAHYLRNERWYLCHDIVLPIIFAISDGIFFTRPLSVQSAMGLSIIFTSFYGIPQNCSLSLQEAKGFPSIGHYLRNWLYDFLPLPIIFLMDDGIPLNHPLFLWWTIRFHSIAYYLRNGRRNFSQLSIIIIICNQFWDSTWLPIIFMIGDVITLNYSLCS